MKRHQFLLTLVGFLSGSCKPSRSTVAATHSSTVPLIEFLDGIVVRGQDLPANSHVLAMEWQAATDTTCPTAIFYVKMATSSYKLYSYIEGRTSLWYSSEADGSDEARWWIDDETGSMVKYQP